MRAAARTALPIAAATVALVLLLALRPISVSRAFAIWILLLAAIVLAALVRSHGIRTGRERQSRFELALRPRTTEASPPAELVRVQRQLELGIANADYAHRRLLPLLRAAAAARLGSQHGFELGRRPEAARALLGDDVWELLRPDRPEPADRHGRGVDRARVAEVVERVESL